MVLIFLSFSLCYCKKFFFSCLFLCLSIALFCIALFSFCIGFGRFFSACHGFINILFGNVIFGSIRSFIFSFLFFLNSLLFSSSYCKKLFTFSLFLGFSFSLC